MKPRPSEHLIRREITLLERHLTCWPTSPRLKMRLAEERAKLNRIETARAQALRGEILRALRTADETTLAQLAGILRSAS